MASTTPLPTLLRTLNIGVDAAAGEKEPPSSSAHAAPKLALSDQLHLLAAHIDTLEKSITASVSSAEGSELVSRQTRQAIELQDKVGEVQQRVGKLQDQKNVASLGGDGVLESLAQFIRAQKALDSQRGLHAVTSLIRDAVYAVEMLEGRLQAGQMDAQGLASAIAQANHTSYLLGIRGAEQDKQITTAAKDFRWIAQASGTPPLAIRELGSRLERAKDAVKQRLVQCWNSAVLIHVQDDTAMLTISDNAEGEWMCCRVCATFTHDRRLHPIFPVCHSTLPQLMETLQARAELDGLLRKLADDLLLQIVPPLLTGGHQWMLDVTTASEWRIARNEGSNDQGTSIKALVFLLGHVQRRLLSLAPSPSPATFTFSKVLVPALLPILLKHLKAALPTRLEKPIASTTLADLARISQEAREAYEALLEGGYLQDGLRDEAEELLDWAGNTHRHYMKNIGMHLRKRARELLLREAGGGWQAVTIEVEMEAEVPKAVKEHVQQGRDAVEVDSLLASRTSGETDGEAEDTWASWGNDEGVKSQLVAGEAQRTSSPSSKNRQKKSALGGRRVVKPSDELGSGPLPEDALGDDVSWGFDDPLPAAGSTPATSTSAGPSRQQYDALMESLDEEEDVDEDAWGLTEEEKVERAAKRASMRGDMAAAFQAYQTNHGKQAQTQAAAGLGDIADAEEDDQDDAWGLSAQESEALDVKRQSLLLAKHEGSAGANEPAMQSEIDDDDDDAWGLSAQEREVLARKRQSVLMPSAPPPSSSVPADKNEDTPTDEAEVLPKKEPVVLAQKRQSTIFAEPAVAQDDYQSPTSKGTGKDQRTQSFDKASKTRSEVDGEDDVWSLSAQETSSAQFGASDENVTQANQSPEEWNIPHRSDSSNADRGPASSDKATNRSHSPRTSATSSSFTRTSRPFDMETDEGGSSRNFDKDENVHTPASIRVAEQPEEKHKRREVIEESGAEEEAEELEDAWDVKDDTLSEGAATGASGGKSSGSGEKLSDGTTEPWEEIAAPTVHVNTPAVSGASEWTWNDDEGAGASGAGVAGVAAAASLASAHRARSPLARAGSTRSAASGKGSPQLRQATLRSASAAARKSSLSHGKSARPPPKEKCLISQRSISLVELVKEVLDGIEAVLDEGQANALEIDFLTSALNDVLDLHRALLPVGHADTLTNVPSLAMQFANDCSFIGKALREMRGRWEAIQTRRPDKESIDFDLQAQLTMALGKRSFDGQMLLQHKMLMDCLVDADSFARTYEDGRFQACQRSVKQVEYVLNQLQSAWKPVLPQSSYLAAMGRLVDGVLKRVLLDIESLEDISEIESEKLASVMKSLGELEHLFRDEGRQSNEVRVYAFSRIRHILTCLCPPHSTLSWHYLCRAGSRPRTCPRFSPAPSSTLSSSTLRPALSSTTKRPSSPA